LEFVFAFLSGVVFGFTMVSTLVAFLGVLFPQWFGFGSRVEALKFIGFMFLALFVMAMLENLAGTSGNKQPGLFAFFTFVGVGMGTFHTLKRKRGERVWSANLDLKSKLVEAWCAFKEEVAQELARQEALKEEKRAKQEKRVPKEASDVYRDELLLEYRDADGNFSKRKISDIDFDGTYLKVYCHKRHDERTFRLDRVESLADTVTGEVIADVELYLFRHYG